MIANKGLRTAQKLGWCAHSLPKLAAQRVATRQIARFAKETAAAPDDETAARLRSKLDVIRDDTTQCLPLLRAVISNADARRKELREEANKAARQFNSQALSQNTAQVKQFSTYIDQLKQLLSSLTQAESDVAAAMLQKAPADEVIGDTVEDGDASNAVIIGDAGDTAVTGSFPLLPADGLRASIVQSVMGNGSTARSGLARALEGWDADDDYSKLDDLINGNTAELQAVCDELDIGGPTYGSRCYPAKMHIAFKIGWLLCKRGIPLQEVSRWGTWDAACNRTYRKFSTAEITAYFREHGAEDVTRRVGFKYELVAGMVAAAQLQAAYGRMQGVPQLHA